MDCDSTLIYEEEKVHNDIVMFNFLDTYLNLTIKTLVSLNWAVNTYNTQMFIKNDDDVIFNVKIIYHRLVTSKPTGALIPRAIMGICFIGGVVPVRGCCDKFSISQSVYPRRKYPVYCGGGNYAITKTAVLTLLNHSLSTTLLSLEDVSLGFLAEKAGDVNVIKIPDWLFYPKSQLNISKDPDIWRKYYSVHTNKISPVDMETLWYKVITEKRVSNQNRTGRHLLTS